MKKMTFRKLFGGICCAAMAMFAVSCAQGADDESWSAGVTNTQLEPPTIDDSCFDVISTSDGDKVQFTWPVVIGAGGYHVTVVDQSAPDTPVVDEQVDGQTIAFAMVEDTNFTVSVTALGNDRLNNTASGVGEYVFSTFGTLLEIPDGSEIASWIEANYVAPEKEIFGLVYQLAAGGQYTLDASANFNLDKVMLRTADASNPATVTVGEAGRLETQAGLKVLDIYFDCTNAKQNGLIYLCDTPDESLKNLTGGSKGSYIIMKPIIMQNCWVKNLPNSFLYSPKGYGLMDFRVLNSIIQMKNSGKLPFLYMQTGNTATKDFIIQNSTIFNIAKGSGFFIAMSNQNRSRVFGNSACNPSNTKWSNSTLVLPGNSKNIADRAKADNEHTFSLIGNILYDFKGVNRLQNLKVYENNTIFCQGSTDSQDYDADYLASGKTEAPHDPQFAGPIDQELDFSQPNGGVNFTPAGNALTDRRGDPRWLN